MVKVNSISGGKTSSYIAKNYPADYDIFSVVCLDDYRCAPKDKSIIQYANAKLEHLYSIYGEFIATAEDDMTLKAVIDLEQYIGREIKWVRGRSFDSIIDDKNYTRLPSKMVRYCTIHMKLKPIFDWCFYNIEEQIQMRIGFRFDEYDRMERFFNDSDPTYFKIPISCSLKGKRMQKHQLFKWRKCHFPLIKDIVTKEHINKYWEQNGYIGGTLFEERRKIEFPIVSNCVGCFHKKPDTLCIMGAMHPEKMNWFAEQEAKGKGTWLDGLSYNDIIKNSLNWIPEMLTESGAACDSGGCHD